MPLLATVWFTWDASGDLRRLFKTLCERAVDEWDNGQVIGHRNVDEVAGPVNTDGI